MVYHEEEVDTLALHHIHLDEDSRLLTVTGAHHLIVYSYKKKEVKCDVPVSLTASVKNSFDFRDC